jgi:dsDNA-specific endonuclease/ATPase MutS2
MPIRKKRPSASDVLRQEMQQPLVIPARNPSTEPNPTPNTNTNMTPTHDDAAAAQLKKAQESEAKLQQQIEDLNSKLKAQATDLKDAKDTIVKLAEQGQAPAKSKSAALVKKDTSRSNASITARPTESHEETARRRANTDIGWLD